VLVSISLFIRYVKGMELLRVKYFMYLLLFESSREWVQKTRRREGSKKLLIRFSIESARNLRVGCNRLGDASDKIIAPIEPALSEFIVKQGSSEASWLNIKQLTESQLNKVSSSLQGRYKP